MTHVPKPPQTKILTQGHQGEDDRRATSKSNPKKIMRLAPTFLSKPILVRRNPNLLDSRPKPPQTKYSAQGHQGRHDRRAPSKSKQKIMKRGSPYFSKKNPKFWVRRNPNLLDSRPQTSSDKNIDTRTPRGDDRRATVKIKPKIMKEARTFF
jgi:hypothetical protein